MNALKTSLGGVSSGTRWVKTAPSKDNGRMIRVLLLLFAFLFVTSCGKVTMRPTLSSSVGFDALEELGEIRRAPVHVAVLIDSKLRDLQFRLEYAQAIYNVPVGRAIAAKVVKLASYQFEEVSIVKSGSHAAPLLLRVALQHEQPGLTVDVARRGITIKYDIKAKIDLRIRASLADQDGTIWVGTARVTDELTTGGLEGSGAAIDISRGISEAVDRATDRLVANLMRQVRRSESLRKYLATKP